MRNLLWILLLALVCTAGCKGRYSGFPDTIAEDAIEREGKIAKQDVVAAAGKVKVGMTEQEVMALLQPYNVNLGHGSVVGEQRVALIYLIHGILVDVKYDGFKGQETDKVIALDVRTFHGW